MCLIFKVLFMGSEIRALVHLANHIYPKKIHRRFKNSICFVCWTTFFRYNWKPAQVYTIFICFARQGKCKMWRVKRCETQKKKNYKRKQEKCNRKAHLTRNCVWINSNDYSNDGLWALSPLLIPGTSHAHKRLLVLRRAHICTYAKSFAKGYLPSAISFRDEMQFVQFFTLVCKEILIHINTYKFAHAYTYANVVSPNAWTCKFYRYKVGTSGWHSLVEYFSVAQYLLYNLLLLLFAYCIWIWIWVCDTQ